MSRNLSAYILLDIRIMVKEILDQIKDIPMYDLNHIYVE